jgi:hypothetical protein
VEAVAVAFSMAWLAAQVEGKTGDDGARGLLAAFRGELYRCFATYRDALFELADAVLCKQDRVHMLVELSLEPEHRRGHGALYGAVNWAGSISRGCAGRWRACRCRPGTTGGSGWRPM